MKLEKLGQVQEYASRCCPVCGCRIVNRIFSLRMRLDDLGLSNEYNVVSCDYCGMCYANTTATESDYDRYYQASNAYGGLPTAIDVKKPGYMAIEEIIERFASHDAAILDIGFGDGGNIM